MPLAALRHPDNPFVWCGENLQACEECQNRCAPLPVARAIWYVLSMGEGHYHDDPMRPSVTDMIGCPRQAALKATMDYTEALPALTARSLGTWQHTLMEKANEDHAKCEVELSVPVAGGELTGTVDHLERGALYDWKFRASPRKTVDDKDARQLSCYRDMALAAGLVDEDCTLNLCEITPRGPNVHEADYDPEALPCARDRAEQYLRVVKGEMPVSSLPPVGKEVRVNYRGRLCDYCPFEIKAECERIEAEG